MIRGMKIVDRIVDNVALFDTEVGLFDGWSVAPDDVGVGYTDNGDGTFTAPPQPDPIVTGGA